MSHGKIRWRIVRGVVAVAIGALALASGLFGSADTAPRLTMLVLGAILIFFGVSRLTPLVARPAALALGWPFRRLYGVSGEMARGNAARNPLRTASTATALMIGLALVSMASVVGASFKDSFTEQIDRGITADYFLSTDDNVTRLQPRRGGDDRLPAGGRHRRHVPLRPGPGERQDQVAGGHPARGTRAGREPRHHLGWSPGPRGQRADDARGPRRGPRPLGRRHRRDDVPGRGDRDHGRRRDLHRRRRRAGELDHLPVHLRRALPARSPARHGRGLHDQGRLGPRRGGGHRGPALPGLPRGQHRGPGHLQGEPGEPDRPAPGGDQRAARHVAVRRRARHRDHAGAVGLRADPGARAVAGRSASSGARPAAWCGSSR